MHIEDDQIKNQVIAALKFWCEIADKSQRHPSRHPVVEEMFKQHPPMLIGDILGFIETHESEIQKLTTITEAAKKYNIPTRTLRRWVQDAGIKSQQRHGRTRFYRESDIQYAAGLVLRRIYYGTPRGRPPAFRRD